MSENFISKHLDSLVAEVEKLSESIGKNVEVTYILKEDIKSEGHKVRGKLTVVSKLGSDEWSYFLIIKVRKNYSENRDFFGKTEYILSVKDFKTKELLYELNKKRKTPH